MVRSKWKSFCSFKDGNLVHSKLFLKKRSMNILPMKYYTYYVYNGKYFLPITWNDRLRGKKLGEFVFTRKKCMRSPKRKK
jgi:ribosomal protein S19